MQEKKKIFDNTKVESLISAYQKTGDKEVLNSILEESTSLIEAISNKPAFRDILNKEDLKQEAYKKLIEQVINRFDPGRNSLAYSYFSVAISNAMSDYARKERQVIAFDETAFDIACDNPPKDESEFFNSLVDHLKVWFHGRFSFFIDPQFSTAILESILYDIMDSSCSKRRTVERILSDFGYSRKQAVVMYDSVVVKLRTLYTSVYTDCETPEDTILPELKEYLGKELYDELATIFSGIEIKFEKLNK